MASLDIDVYNNNPDTQFSTNNKVAISVWLRNEKNNYFYTFGIDWEGYLLNGIPLESGYTIKDFTTELLEIFLTNILAENRFNCNVNIDIATNGIELITTITDLTEV